MIAAEGKIYLSAAVYELNSSIAWRESHPRPEDESEGLRTGVIVGVAVGLGACVVVAVASRLRYALRGRSTAKQCVPPPPFSRRRRRAALLQQHALALLVAERLGCSLTTFQTGAGAEWAVVRANGRVACALSALESAGFPAPSQLCSRIAIELSEHPDGLSVGDCEALWSGGPADVPTKIPTTSLAGAAESPEIASLANIVADVLQGPPYLLGNVGSRKQCMPRPGSVCCCASAGVEGVSIAALQGASVAAAEVAGQVIASASWTVLRDAKSRDTDRILPQGAGRER